MSGTIFPISTNKSDYCFNPLVCATDHGHLVVWAYGVDVEQTTLWARVYTDQGTTQAVVKIGTTTDEDHVLFLRRLTKQLYILAVETTKGTTIYFMDENANVCDHQLYNNTNVLIHCHATDDEWARPGVVLFTYNHEDHTFNVGTVPHSEDWNEEYILEDTFADVYGIPQVFVKGDQYTAGWITREDTLQVVNNSIAAVGDGSNSIAAGGDGSVTTLDPYDVDYLMATEVDKDTVVYSGYNSQTRVLRLDFFTVADGKHICSRYWKNKE